MTKRTEKEKKLVEMAFKYLPGGSLGNVVMEKEEAFKQVGIPAQASGMETCFDVYFTDRPVRTYRDALKTDTGMLEKYKKAMRKHRILKNKHKYYPSLCHTDEDVEQTIVIFEKVAEELKG